MDAQIPTPTRPDPRRDEEDRAQPSPFKCNVCQRTYARIDHLSRHFRLREDPYYHPALELAANYASSDTSERPYRCEACFKTFNRPDLLKRHALIHLENDQQHHKTHLSRPRRVTQACRACAASKLKCKEKKPCQRCETKGITCEYNEIDSRLSGSWQSQQLAHGDTSLPQSVGTPLPEDNSPAYARKQHMQLQEVIVTDDSLTSIPAPGDSNLKDGEDFMDDHLPHVNGTSNLLSGDSRSAELMECDDNMFAEFLRDVMMPVSVEQFDSQQLATSETESQAMAFRNLLSFGLESDLELNEQDYNIMNLYQGRVPYETESVKDSGDNQYSTYEQLVDQTKAPGKSNAECIALGAKAFRSSLWCWTPARADTASIDQHNLTVQPCDMSSPSTQFVYTMHGNTDCIDTAIRDKIVAMILSTTSRSSFSKVMSSFPSVELLNNLVHSFFASHIAQSDTWIHIPTLKLGRQRAVLLGSIISAGAVLSTSLTIRKLGFAIHEAVRQALPKVCEENNSATRDLGLLQAMVLNLNTGLWSGNKRKIELAESHAGIVATMCRRASRFLRSTYTVIVPLETDHGEVLKGKWRSWIQQESLKRLVFALFTRDAQTSISFIVPTIISYAELSLPLPESRNLFLSRTAEEWKSTYLTQISPGRDDERIPSLQQCLYDVCPLNAPSMSRRIDTALSLSITAYGIWGLILEYRQLNSVAKSYSSSHVTPSVLVLEHRHQELCQILQLFSGTLSELEPSRTNLSSTDLQSKMLVELLLMHLHVSFEHLQLFAGREGEEEARRVYPSLQQWASSREARSAIFRAGQVIRYAKLLNSRRNGVHGGVRDFFAVAVYHSALTFWAFGVLGFRSGNNHSLQQLGRVEDRSAMPETGYNNREEMVWLDAEESSATRSFIALSRGVPCFSTTPAGVDATMTEIARLCEPHSVMIAIIEVLRGRFSGQENDSPLPPLVENLSQLIKELGDAARDV